MEQEQSISKTSLSTVIVMICTLLSRILGFVRIAVITAFFGASGNADVINLTFAIPNNLRKLLAEGALSSAFIPVLSHSMVKNGRKSVKTRSLVRSLLTFQLIILIPLSILSMIFAEPLITKVFTRFTDPEQIRLSISLFRYFINYLVFISISAVMMAVINSSNHFLIPAITPLLFSVSVIFSILFLYGSMGIYSMAFGVITGGILQVMFQYPMFRKLGFDFVPSFSFKSPYFIKIIRNWIPVLATSAVFTINQQVAFLFASGLEAGSTSALSNALVFWQLPFGIFSASITTVLFPRMSRQAARKDTDGIRESISTGLRMLFALLIPSAIVLGMFGKIIISSALQRGLFTADNTLMTSNVLKGYVFGLFSVGAFNFIQRYFYAVKDFRTPFIVSSVVCIMDIILSLILKDTSLRITGLAVANSISFSVGFLLLYIIARHRLGFLFTRKLFETALKVFISVIPSVLISLLLLNIQGEKWKNGANLSNIADIIYIFILWIIPTLFMYRLLNVEALSFLLKRRKKHA